MAISTATGKFPSHTTKTCSVLGLPILGTKECNWKVSVEREKQRGMARNPLGVTEGDADYEFSATFLRPEWEKLKARIRTVYGVAPMDCKGKIVITDSTPGQAFDDLVEKVSNAFNDLFTYLGEVWEGFKSFGKAIADGIWNGLKGAWDALVTKFKGLLDQLPLTVKKALGIASPSKVMAQLGGWTVEGFSKGVDDKSDGAHAALSQAVAPPKMTLSGFAANSNGSGSGARSISVGDINVTVGGSTATPHQIAKSVRDEVLAVFGDMAVEAGAA